MAARNAKRPKSGFSNADVSDNNNDASRQSLISEANTQRIAQYMPLDENLPLIKEFTKAAILSGLNLIDQLEIYLNAHKITHKICTSESLTAGLILSTLVDIPRFGVYKYGGFGVYDTDAKRVFNRVLIKDVYTHECAEQMAQGILLNSNASIAIAVTGNAMPLTPEREKLGEVFIGVAGYTANPGQQPGFQISTYSTVFNATHDFRSERNTSFIMRRARELCTTWISYLNRNPLSFNPTSLTAAMSKLIRLHTVNKALAFCTSIIKDNTFLYPAFLGDTVTSINTNIQKDRNGALPAHKYPNRQVLLTQPTQLPLSKIIQEHGSGFMLTPAHTPAREDAAAAGNDPPRALHNPMQLFSNSLNSDSTESPSRPPSQSHSQPRSHESSQSLFNALDAQHQLPILNNVWGGGAAGKQRRKHIHRTYKRKHKK